MDQQKQKLVTDNMGLAVYLAKQYLKEDGIEWEDLRGTAYLGLCKAANTYDQSKTQEFAAYAGKVIRNEIFMSFRKQRKKAKDISLQEPVEGRDVILADILPDKKDCFREIEQFPVESFINGSMELTEREKQVIVQSIVYGKRQQEMSKEIGLSQSYISRLYKSGLKRLREEYMQVYA